MQLGCVARYEFLLERTLIEPPKPEETPAEEASGMGHQSYIVTMRLQHTWKAVQTPE